uniref:Uncharacterized protein n=1 Tax=Oryza glumipatula TaxID=40148 RepID=A0A0D9ZII6_9ORYZ
MPMRRERARAAAATASPSSAKHQRAKRERRQHSRVCISLPPDGGEQLNYGMVDVTPTAFFHQTHHHHPNLTGDDYDELPPPFSFLPPSPSFTTPHLAGDDDNRNDVSARYVSTSFLSAPSIATIATTAAGSSLSSSSPVLLLPTSSAPASSSPLRAPPVTVTAALKGLPERRLVLPPLGGVLLHLLPDMLRCSLAARNFHELFHALLLFLNPPC